MGEGRPEELLALVEKWHREDAAALRQAFVDGANWLEYWRWDQRMGPTVARRVREEAMLRWPDGEVSGD